MSDEHFTVDGTVLEAWASLKSLQRHDAGPTAPPDDLGNPPIDFHGETRKNDTHQSTTDPDTQLYRKGKGKGKEAKVAYLGHVLLDHRHGLVANVCTTAATGTGEWEAALLMLEQAATATTVGGDKHYDVARFVTPTRQLGITPHVAQKDTGSRIDARTTRHDGYAISQRRRKLVEQVFGWMKTVGGLRKLRHRGGELVDWVVTFTAAAYNLVRLRTLLATPA
jgi:IS5 family transposase